MDLGRLFPKLKSGSFSITSPRSASYNCIAWAAEDSERWWWPRGGYWPQGVPEEEGTEAFVAAFEALGYTTCADGELERGFQKIALYANPQGQAKHAARQLPSGRWTSKCGSLEDIEHELGGLEAADYGNVAVYMRWSLA